MPRKPREFVDGAFYHVYARIARGEGVLSDEGAASRLVEIVRVEVPGMTFLTLSPSSRLDGDARRRAGTGSARW